MRDQIIKEFKLFKTTKATKSPREVLNIFSDIFIELEDMGGWLSFASGSRLYNIESENEIEVQDGKISLEFKSKLDTIREQRDTANHNQIYLFLKSNLDSLINKFENVSGCEVSGLSGSVSIGFGPDGDQNIEIIDFRTNIWKNRLKMPDINSLLKNGGKIDNICFALKISI